MGIVVSNHYLVQLNAWFNERRSDDGTKNLRNRLNFCDSV